MCRERGFPKLFTDHYISQRVSAAVRSVTVRERAQVQAIEVQQGGSTHTWNSGVHIKKCRYMEQTACAGICTNLCKASPSPFMCARSGDVCMRASSSTCACSLQVCMPHAHRM